MVSTGVPYCRHASRDHPRGTVWFYLRVQHEVRDQHVDQRVGAQAADRHVIQRRGRRRAQQRLQRQRQRPQRGEGGHVPGHQRRRVHAARAVDADIHVHALRRRQLPRQNPLHACLHRLQFGLAATTPSEPSDCSCVTRANAQGLQTNNEGIMCCTTHSISSDCSLHHVLPAYTKLSRSPGAGPGSP